MADKPQSPTGVAELIGQVMRLQTEAIAGIFGAMGAGPAGGGGEADRDDREADHSWSGTLKRLQEMWDRHQAEKQGRSDGRPSHYTDASNWAAVAESLAHLLPLARPDVQQGLWEESLAVFEEVLAQFGMGPAANRAGTDDDGGAEERRMPRTDPRFADPAWREQPFFAVLHQLYLMLAERVTAMADDLEGVEPARKAQARFATRTIADALSPANFALTNPVALARAAKTRGESLIKGMEHLIADLERGQLTHSDPRAFRLGETIATTPGKVIHQTPLFQLIQYSPTTEKVMRIPLIIFPPWINRFYILDLNARKSFVRWAVEQGISVFLVSWKSADASMADVTWDDYVAAQIEAIDLVRARLRVPAAHVIGYCVAGTTLAATLAVLARRGEAAKVKSATFLTTQVDFEEAGELKHFVDDQQIDAIARLGRDGYLDGRYLAATFNLLRGNDLIWNYVEKNYLKGEDYPAFDMLHWNGDYTNLPLKWHCDYLRDLYRDNRLVVPDSLRLCDIPVDLRRIETPAYVQAGREDHIAPPHSVWKMTRHLAGPWSFVLAGSGHIAGVINPPAAGKYQYWTMEGAAAETFDGFLSAAAEHGGSWWPHWLAWLRSHDDAQVAVRGKRRPGGRGDTAIEDAPGSYVKTR